MKRSGYLAIALVLLALGLCGIVVLCGALGAAVYIWSGSSDWPVTSLPLHEQPAPAPAIAYSPPASAELQAARLIADSTLPERDPVDLAYRLKRVTEPVGLHVAGSPPEYRLGDSIDLWVLDEATSTHFSATAVLQYETPHTYWWVEKDTILPAADLERSAEAFETQTYPTNRHLFGSEWTPGVDADPHVYIYLGNVPGVGGYFSAPDEFPAEISPFSNEHEMFYINLGNASPGNDYFDGILAHEFQHMIHWAVDRNEASWVNEGLSEAAAWLNGYDVGGSDYLFSLAPDTQLTTWAEPEEAGPHYGASFLFVAYLVNQYGEGILPRLVAEQTDGAAGVETVLGETEAGDGHFNGLFADWVVANYLDDPHVADGRYGYRDLEIEPPAVAARHASFPIYEEAVVHQYAADYIEIEGSGDVTVEFTGSLTVPLVGNTPRSGRYQWWSNRGDDGDVTLTRPLDLSGLSQATLRAWTWYELEEGYDYAYVLVSVDGGDTWEMLTNEHTTLSNPAGNSYGPGWNGSSGGGSEPVWIEQSFDLSAYAGRKVHVRFEVITDEALNGRGVCLDDISIPELGYLFDAEDGTGDWQADGWLRVGGQLPQQFAVQLITIGASTQVQRMALDNAHRGSLRIAGLGGDVRRAVLIVSGMTPGTTEWASYAYGVTRD